MPTAQETVRIKEIDLCHVYVFNLSMKMLRSLRQFDHMLHSLFVVNSYSLEK